MSPSTGGNRHDEPVAGLDPHDPRVLQILSAEHQSLLSERSLVYNDAFTRVGTFLTLVSTSLVALALLAQGMSFNRGFMVVATVTSGSTWSSGSRRSHGSWAPSMTTFAPCTA